MLHHNIGRVVIILLFVGFFLSGSVDAQAQVQTNTTTTTTCPNKPSNTFPAFYANLYEGEPKPWTDSLRCEDWYTGVTTDTIGDTNDCLSTSNNRCYSRNITCGTKGGITVEFDNKFWCYYCRKGYKLDGNTCVPCPQNTYGMEGASFGLTFCNNCPDGKISSVGMSSVNHCNAAPNTQALAPAGTCPSGFTFTPCVEPFEFGPTGNGLYCSLFLTAPWDESCNMYELCSVCKCSCNNPVSNANGCGPQAPYDPCVANNYTTPIPRVPAGSIDFVLQISINDFDTIMQTKFISTLSTLYEVATTDMSISNIIAYADTRRRRRLLTVGNIQVTVEISTEYTPATTIALNNAMSANNLPTASATVRVEIATTPAGMLVSMRVKVVQDAGNEVLSVGTTDQIKQFFQTQTTQACAATDCQLTVAKLGFTVAANPTRDADGTAWLFDVTLDIPMPDNARTMVVKQSFRLTSSVLQAKLLEQDPQLGFSINTYGIVYRTDTTRPSVCGDSVLIASEECDDGNTANGDGCSATCILETGYMCYGARRVTVGVRGKMTAWTTDTSGKRTLSILQTAEGCLKDDITLQDSRVWAPVDWIATYSTNSPAVTSDMLPPLGFYARRFCERTFPAAVFYEFNNSCMPTGRDECSRGESDCDRNAYCVEPADGVSYECECDERYFVSTLNGTGCDTDGVEVQLTLGGPIGLAADAGSTSFDEGLALITEARKKLMLRLLQGGDYLNNLSSEALLLEGVRRYPIALKQNKVTEEGPMLNRALWTFVLRAPDIHLNMANMAMTGNIFDQMGTWTSLFVDQDINGQPKIVVNSVGQCSNDRTRTCSAADATCLAGAACDILSPDFIMSKLTGGGSAAPLLVGSSGMDVMSVDYDITQAAFNIRMRYDNAVPGVIDTVFVSHMGVGQDPLFLPTFNSDEFPCLPLGTGVFQNQRDNSGVCARGILRCFPREICGHGELHGLTASCMSLSRVQCVASTASMTATARWRSLDSTWRTQACL